MRRLFSAVLVAFLVTASVAGSAAAEPVGSPAATVAHRLSVPYRTQLDGNPYDEADCGPASMAMVLEAYGLEVPTAKVRGMVNDLQGTRGVYWAGTFIENLAVIADRHGLRSYGLFDPKLPRRAPGKNKLRPWTFDELRAALQAGHPVVPQVWYRGLPGRENRPYNGDHFIVITGYVGDEFVYNDPIDKDGPGEGRRISAAQLDRAWRNSDFPYAAVAVAGAEGNSAVAAYVPPAPPRVVLPGGLRPRARIADTIGSI